jgi:hypothetical protein
MICLLSEWIQQVSLTGRPKNSQPIEKKRRGVGVYCSRGKIGKLNPFRAHPPRQWRQRPAAGINGDIVSDSSSSTTTTTVLRRLLLLLFNSTVFVFEFFHWR